MVGTGLRHQRKRNGILAVTPKARTRILRFIMDVRDIGNTNHGAVGSGLHRNIFESLRVKDSSERADGKCRFASFDATRRQFKVALLESSRHFGTGNTKRLQAHRVNPQAHRRTLFAPDSHFRNTVDGLQTFLDKVVRQFRNFHRVKPIAHETHHQNRVVIAVGLVHSRFIDIVWEPAAHAAHTVADFVRRRFKVHACFEFNIDERKSVAARRGQRLDSGRTVDRSFQNFGHFGFDHGSVCTRVRSTHLNQRIVHIRIFAHAQVRRAKGAKQDDDERHHGHEHRTTYGKGSDTHRLPTPLRNRYYDGFLGFGQTFLREG